MTNLDIAQSATMRPITEVAAQGGLLETDYEIFGTYKAKLTFAGMQRLQRKASEGKLVLVTAISPTPAGEGKTTTVVGLTQGLQKLGARAISATREPALGPVFGVKGGAAGGGYSQVLPMEDINLFLNGDFPAISAAHNLLSAMLDAHIHHGDVLNIDVRQRFWPRTVDMNDRALREVLVALGGKANGYPRQDGFVITPASEVMAILCLSKSLTDLRERLGNIVVGADQKGRQIVARELTANGAMAALLRDAIRPNLVQTMEGGPALVHGGPFANIAHGCSSAIATECGLGLGGFLVTEGGFGADLGAEKFLDIVCRRLGRGPNVIVLVATVRALKHHGGGEDLEALQRGMANLHRHLDHLRHYGPPVLVSINSFPTDTLEEHEAIIDSVCDRGVVAVVSDPWGSGGDGCTGLAEAVRHASGQPSKMSYLYADDASPVEKMEAIARKAYGAEGVELTLEGGRALKWCVDHGLGDLPVCMAKTQYSLSDDPKKLNAPTGFKIRIRDVRPSAGAGFLVAVSGEIMLMPGLGKEPAAQRIDVDDHGKIIGLF